MNCSLNAKKKDKLGTKIMKQSRKDYKKIAKNNERPRKS